MQWLGIAGALALMIVVLVDAFEALILPRRVSHPFRLAKLYYRSAWLVWRSAANCLRSPRWRTGFLGAFGPISLFGLIAVWAVGLLVSFALMNWSHGTVLRGEQPSFANYLYLSGTTFFTLGYGDIVPIGRFGRLLSVVEAGAGFGFLAIVISYLPVLYQAFSRREVIISLLDARAGSPPTACELLRRAAQARQVQHLPLLLGEWERWSAELLENTISFPVLSYYRSQHDNQSWLAALTVMLDTCALLIAETEGEASYQARLTFAMARHAAVDLVLVFQAPAQQNPSQRLAPAAIAELRALLVEQGIALRDEPAAAATLAELRRLYEPFVAALAGLFRFALPKFQPQSPVVDNWQTSAWMPRSPGLNELSGGTADDHFN